MIAVAPVRTRRPWARGAATASIDPDAGAEPITAMRGDGRPLNCEAVTAV